jgi:hypothetical protein
MKNIIISTAIVFFVNSFLTSLINYIVSDKKGEIIVSDLIKIDSLRSSQIILISNYEKKSIDNLEFSTKNGMISNLITNSPIQIKNISKKKFIIEKIYPSTNLTIKADFIRNINDNGEPNIFSLNHEDFSFDFQKSCDFEPKKLINWYMILIIGFMTSIFYGITIYFMDWKFENMMKVDQKKVTEISYKLNSGEKRLKEFEEQANVKIKQLQAQIKEETKKSNKAVKELHQFKIAWTKFKILLFRRARDLEVEKEFYMSLLSEFFKKAETHFDEEKIQNLVREHLKTYSTKKSALNEISSIDIIADIVKTKKKKNKKDFFN